MENSITEELILRSPYTYQTPTFSCQSVSEMMLSWAEKWAKDIPGKNWITNTITGESIKFCDVDPLSRIAASALRKRGMTHGGVALYLTMDATKIFTTMIGVWRLGGIMYSSYPEDTADTLLTRIQQTNCRWIFCDPVSVPQVREASKAAGWPIEIFVFGQVDGCTSVDDLYQDDGSSCPSDPVGTLDDPALVICTSGTTGKSKGAIYTGRCILNFCHFTSQIPYHEKPGLLVTRCTHILGALFPIRSLFKGVWILLMHVVTKQAIFEAVDKYKPCLAFGFPTFLSLLASDPEAVKYDRSSLEMITTGGIVLTPQYHDLMMTLPNMKHVINGYGMSECGAITTTVDLAYSDRIRMIPGVPYLSVGRLYPNSSCKIVDVESGKAVGANMRGEICIQSVYMCIGYWGQPEETASTFKNGWLHTGDVGYYDDDGNIYVVDRLKETFKYFNNHVSPAELEEIMLRHSSIKEACCFGIHDPSGGDRIPRMVVTLKPEANSASAQELQEFVDSKVASYKKLRGGVFIVDSIPRGKTGKFSRILAAEMDLSSY